MATRSHRAFTRFGSSSLVLIALVAACREDPSTAPSSRPESAAGSTSPTVTSTDPAAAQQDTTLDVRVLGSGFDSGSRVDMALNGVVGPGVKTNKTTFKSSKELVANITIAADATPDRYDVIVTTSSGKKGIGTEAFTVVAIQVVPASSDVNGAGQVVGSVSISSSCSATATRPVVWTEASESQPLPVPSDACTASAGLINNAGVIIGSVDKEPYRWLPAGETWTRQPIALEGDPRDINDAGEVAVLRSAGASPVVWKPTVWTPNAGMIELAGLPAAGLGCTSYSINNLQQVVGRCLYLENNHLTPVVWTSLQAQPTVLPQLSGVVRSSADAINDAGVIAGLAMTSRGVKHAVRWVPAGNGSWAIEDLGTLGGDAEARDINNRGQIIGVSQAVGSNFHAFIWEEGRGMRDLGTLGPQGSQAWRINNPSMDQMTLVSGSSYVSTISRPVIWRVF